MKNSSAGSATLSSAPLTGMLDLQLEAVADAVGAILAQQRREWSLEHAAFVAEHKAALADLRRENAELLAALKAAADEQRARVDAALAGVKDGEPGPPGPPGPKGESIVGPQGEKGDPGESIEGQPGAKGDKGDPGESVAGPQGEKGDPGESIEGPAGPKGDKGDPGDSIPGPQGERGIGIAAVVRDGMRLSFELDDGRIFDVGDIGGARGEKGDPGPEGPAARDGRDGLPGVPGANGAPGLDGKDGRNGIDGKDGLGFDDMTVEYDGERCFTFRLARGDNVKEWAHTVPVQLYRGVYVEGRQYEEGDTVTWGGSLYHCNGPTTDKPGAGAAAWTLAVKRGQDGKDGKPGVKGDPGAPGRPGKDLTQMDESGRKW